MWVTVRRDDVGDGATAGATGRCGHRPLQNVNEDTKQFHIFYVFHFFLYEAMVLPYWLAQPQRADEACDSGMTERRSVRIIRSYK